MTDIEKVLSLSVGASVEVQRVVAQLIPFVVDARGLESDYTYEAVGDMTKVTRTV